MAAAAVILAAGCGGQKAPSLDSWLKAKLFPPPTVARVVQVESDLADERREALQAVARDPKATDIEAVVRLYAIVARSDDDALVRSAAVRGLADMKGKDVIETLAHVVVNDSSPLVRRDAAKALGVQADEAGVPALVAALAADQDMDVRVEAAASLGVFRNKAAAEALARAVEQKNIAVARRAWQSLRYVTGQDLPRQTHVWMEYLAAAGDPFVGYGHPPGMPRGVNQRPQMTQGLGGFFKNLFKKDVYEAELE
jgi:HEAT repeat protein